MSLTPHVQEELSQRGYSRRQLARIALGSDVVRITSNENPMGPSKEGLEAIAKVAPLAWRYTP